MARSQSDFAEDGACRSADPDIFFSAPGHSNAPAKRICKMCPVERVCLEWALANPEISAGGVWGGLSDTERKRERARRRRRTATTTDNAPR